MKVLAVTNMMPAVESPRAGTFVQQQIEGLRTVGIEVEVVLVDRVNRGIQEYRKAAKAITEESRAKRPDVVHVMCGGVLGAIGTWSTTSLPTVVSFCGTDLLGYRGARGVLRFRLAVGSWCSRWAAKRADHIVVKSRNLEAGLPQKIDRRFVSVIPNGVDLSRFRPLDRGKCLAHLGWETGVFHVVFATHGPDDRNKRQDLAEETVRTVGRRGVRAELHYLTNTPHEEVPLWLNGACALLVTSEQEGSPNIVKEALSCNRPVVSVDVGDVAERIGGIEGCYLADATAEDLASKLIQVNAGRAEVNARGMMQELTVERVALRLIEVYRKAERKFLDKN